MQDGHMSEFEAYQVLRVAGKSGVKGKWLLAQVHPDRHPERLAEATKATARVNQAMDKKSRVVDSPLAA